MSKKAIILGAGPSGLVSAWKLLENNWNVEVYEKLTIPGGMCRSGGHSRIVVPHEACTVSRTHEATPVRHFSPASR